MAGIEGWLRTAIENAPIVLWAIDQDGTFMLSEGQALRWLGLRPGQVVGMNAFDLYAETPAIAVDLRRGLNGERFRGELEAGGRHWETIYEPILDAAGEVTGLLGVSIDITSRVLAEREKAQMDRQLREVQKLESLGLLAGGIAHDFNNLLTAILGSASTAILTLGDSHPARKDLDNVILGARRAANLTRQLLAYSGRGQFEVKPLNLSDQIRELATLLETTLSKKVQLRLELADQLPAVEADTAQVQQIIMNLVINGAEAIGDQRGTVLVTTGHQNIDERYAKDLFAAEDLRPGEYVYLEVHDTGSGMDEATKAKIFDPFFSTKFLGRGLGLAAVLGIVRTHRGAIRVYTSPGRGTTFKVFFPASNLEVPCRPEALDDFHFEGLVLVVDDDDGVRNTASSILTYFGFSVIGAENGAVAVRKFAERADEVVLVLLDMTMPEMNGEETFRELRRMKEDVRVILTSGYNEIEATRRFTSKGLAAFLQKPFTPTELGEKLRDALKDRPRSEPVAGG